MTWRVETAEAFGFLKTLEDASVDGTITDPPYSSGGQFRMDREKETGDKYTRSAMVSSRFEDFSGDSRDQRSFLAWVALWLSEVYRVSKPGAIVVLFSDWRQLPLMTDAIQIGGFVWRGISVWDKLPNVRPVPLGRMRAQAEYMIWGSKGPMPRKEGADHLPGVFPIPMVRTNDRRHPTEKSIDLLRRLVRLVPPGDLILDPFLGSGTTAVAAILEGRNVIGSEMSAHYAEVSRKACVWAESEVEKRA